MYNNDVYEVMIVKKIIPPKTIALLSALLILLLLSVCSCATHTSTSTSTENLLYNYELIYTYHNTDYDKQNFAKLAELLQSKDVLTVAGTDYTDDNGILRIEYQLKLSEKELNYTINFTRQMQDAIVLLAVFDYIKGVEINFTQGDYAFGGVPIMREQAEKVLGKTIAPFGTTKEKFMKEFPDKVQTVVWQPKVMDTVNYYHAMGLDE